MSKFVCYLIFELYIYKKKEKSDLETLKSESNLIFCKLKYQTLIIIILSFYHELQNNKNWIRIFGNQGPIFILENLQYIIDVTSGVNIE